MVPAVLLPWVSTEQFLVGGQRDMQEAVPGFNDLLRLDFFVLLLTILVTFNQNPIVLLLCFCESLSSWRHGII